MNTGITIVHCEREPYDVYIGRPSKWGNPYRVGVDGTRREVLTKYEEYIRNNPKLLEDLSELDGKILGCWCVNKSCHGEILRRIWNEVISYDLSYLE